MICNWLVVSVLMAATAKAAPIYTVHDLGALGGTTATAFAINSAGLAVGVARDSQGYDRAFSSWGINPSTLSASGVEASASSVNNSGSVAGTVYSNGEPQATVWRKGGSEGIAGPDSYATSINDSGQVTGSSGGHAFVDTNGVTSDLGTLAGGSWSAGYGINNQGQVAGYGDRANGAFQAFLWTEEIGLAPIAGLGGINSYAMAVNNGGQVAGTAQLASGYMRAFRYAAGVTQDLGTLGGGSSYGYGINSLGDIVGNSWTRYDTVTHAFLYRDGAMWDLNLLTALSGWVLTEAYGINESGQIVGAGILNGEQRAFRLDLAGEVQTGSNAIGSAVSAVPEPSTYGLVLLGLGYVVLEKRKRMLRNPREVR